MAKSRRSACSMGSRGAAVADVETCLEGIRRKALDMCVLLALRTECCAKVKNVGALKIGAVGTKLNISSLFYVVTWIPGYNA